MRDLVLVRCAEPAARGIAIFDEAGVLLATAPASSVRARIARSARISVACIDGLRTVQQN
jgi:hypothetical protein